MNKFPIEENMGLVVATSTAIQAILCSTFFVICMIKSHEENLYEIQQEAILKLKKGDLLF